MPVQKTSRILVVDDDPVIRSLIGNFMGKRGYDVAEAEDGCEGIQALTAHLPDIVLCDVKMPVADGLEVLKAVKGIAPQIPVIMISGAGFVSDVVDALRLGAWDYLVKPFTDLTVLEHAVKSCLHRAQLEKENREYREKLEETNRELQSSLAMLREDQEAGRRVQAQLLPDIDGRFGQYRFSHLVIPSLYLSGDFLDYFIIDERYLGFYIADVSGHGSSSAFVTVILKSLISQALRRYKTGGFPLIVRPERLFSYLNSELLHAGLGKYLTMFYGVIDTRNNLLQYVVGGHYPRPIVCCGDVGSFLPGEGLPVGLFEAADYVCEQIPIHADFRLAMFSDGTFEMIDADNLKAKEQFLLDLCIRPELTLPVVRRQLGLDSISTPPDDITVFLLQRKG
ncbi:MAG: response regulator [Deltaproteobacteria bacterium]|nr:response regulator [Deltaproteobacteria bacterium]